MAAPTRDNETQGLFAPFDVRAFSSAVDASLIAELRDEETSTLSAMAAARQAEFATARACARAALADLGVDAAVPRQESGAPQWPVGFAGSISHTRGFCLAIASHDAQAIGIDAEEVARMKPAVERRILVDAERRVATELFDADRRLFVATVFAAKEAFYKAHYEIDARYLGFDAVHVTVEDVDHASGVVTFNPASGDVAPEMLARTQGRFRLDRGRVIVGVAISAPR